MLNIYDLHLEVLMNLNNGYLLMANYKSCKIAVKNTISRVGKVTIIKSGFTNHYFQFAKAGLMFQI